MYNHVGYTIHVYLRAVHQLLQMLTVDTRLELLQKVMNCLLAHGYYATIGAFCCTCRAVGTVAAIRAVMSENKVRAPQSGDNQRIPYHRA